MHKLVAKQLAKATKGSGEVDILLLADLVGAAYEDHDRDRRRTDRSIALMIEELDRLNSRLLDAFDVVPEGLVLFDAQDRFVLWNRKYLELIGLPESAIKAGVTTFESALRVALARKRFPHAAGREEEWLKERLARHAQPQNTEEEVLADRWIRVEERRTRDGGSIGVRVDITELKRREESFRLLFDSNPVPMFVVERRTRRFLAVNDAAVAKYGYSREQLLGMDLFQLIAPEERERVIQEAKADRLVVGGEVTRRHQTADGRILDVAVFSRGFDYAGNQASIAAAIDITERERAREAERRNAEILSATVTSMVDAVLVVDELGRIRLANPAAVRLFGPIPDIDYRKWSLMFERFEADGTTPFPDEQAPIARALRGESVDDLEFVLRRWGSSTKADLVVTGRPLREADGSLKGAVVVYRDVTKAKETERELRHAQKMEAIGQLTGGIAHDFNNLLTVMIGTIGVLAEALKDKPNLVALARTIDDAATRAADLTQQLLAFARKQPLQPRRTDVNAIIENTIKLLRPTLGEQISVETKLDPEAWGALVDPNQLATALLNLAVNARDAMPNGGALRLESANVNLNPQERGNYGAICPSPHVMISVSDTGMGIPVAIRDRVFEPFFTTKEVGKGTGLGLSMVYGFVKQSGGHITIDSQESQGTTIKIFLPRASEELVWGTEIDSVATIERGSERILVVEDDLIVREHVVAQLESLGYAVAAAASAAEALSKFDDGIQFDLLFTDIVMPGGMNGQELAEETLRRRPSVKVLYTSGYNESLNLIECSPESAVTFLAKPYRKSELAVAIRRALNSAHSLEPDGLAPSPRLLEVGNVRQFHQRD